MRSANENYDALGQTKRVGGNIAILVVRPQEALSAVQDLTQAYYSYYGSVADYNRSQFRLYRALGNPAQALVADAGLFGPSCPTYSAPAVPVPFSPSCAKPAPPD